MLPTIEHAAVTAAKIWEFTRMVRLVLEMVTALPAIYGDITGFLAEIKSSDTGQTLIAQSITALEKLLSDLKAAIEPAEQDGD